MTSKQSFLESHPYLKKEIDDEQNRINDINVTKLSVGSNVIINWECSNFGHKFRAKVKDRTSRNYNCPICKFSTPNHNLTILYPELLEEWDYERNTSPDKMLDPSKITPQSSQYAWWVCTYCSKNWQATVSNRVNSKSKSGCKSCASKISKTKNNNLVYLFPSIVAEWYDEQNVNLKPSEVAPNSNLKIK